MLTINALFRDAVLRLDPLYDHREAQQVCQLVFEDAFGIRKPELSDMPVSPNMQSGLDKLLFRLLEGEPVQYVLGQADFYGLKFLVDKNVLIPRPETEELVHRIIKTLGQKKIGDRKIGDRKNGDKKNGDKKIRILDIGTGSGCIAISLAHYLPSAEVTGLDLSEAALNLARENASRLGVKVNWIHADALHEKSWKEWGRFDLIVSNPPYIALSERELMPARVKDHEPKMALFTPESDPLIFYRTIAKMAPDVLANSNDIDKSIYLEINEFRAAEVQEIFEKSAGFGAIEIGVDMQGKARMLLAALH